MAEQNTDSFEVSRETGDAVEERSHDTAPRAVSTVTIGGAAASQSASGTMTTDPAEMDPIDQEHQKLLGDLLDGPTADKWRNYAVSFGNLKIAIRGSDDSKDVKAISLEFLYAQAEEHFVRLFEEMAIVDERAKGFKLRPQILKSLCGHAYLGFPCKLSQAEADVLERASVPLDELPSLFQVE